MKPSSSLPEGFGECPIDKTGISYRKREKKPMEKDTQSDEKDYLCPEDAYLQGKDLHLQLEDLYLQPEYIPFSILQTSLPSGQDHFEAKGKHPYH